MKKDNMLLTIEQLQRDIQQHKGNLNKSEYLTRRVLVDPLLEALGYDILGAKLAVEYTYTRKRVDYALWSEPTGKRPSLFVEAKKLGEDTGLFFGDKPRFEQQRYFASYIALTDGNVWQVYDTSPRKIDENRCIEMQISKQSSSDCTDKLEQLEALLRDTKLDSRPSLGWISLANFSGALANKARPSAIRFPDGEEHKTTSWYHIVEHTARWLWSNGHFTVRQPRIPVVPGGGSYIVSPDSTCRDDHSWLPIGDEKEDLFVSKQGGRATGRHSAWERAKTLLSYCGVTSGDVYLQAPR